MLEFFSRKRNATVLSCDSRSRGRLRFKIILYIVLFCILFFSVSCMSNKRLVIHRYQPKPTSSEQYFKQDIKNLTTEDIEKKTENQPGTYNYEKELMKL